MGKHSPETSEDGIVTTADYVAVIDGSTSKTQHPLRADISNGRLAMTTIASFIQEMPGDVDCLWFCQSITRHIQKLYQEYGIDRSTLTRHPERRVTASAIIYSVRRKEIWMVGDCQCMVDGVPFTNEKPHEQANAERRAQVIRHALAEGRTTVEQLRHEDIGRRAILPAILHSCRRQNLDFAVIDGFDIAMNHVRMLLVPTAQEIVLASDGYPLLFEDLASTEAYLQETIKEDPLFISRHPATKGVMAGNQSFDDRSYVRFRVG